MSSGMLDNDPNSSVGEVRDPLREDSEVLTRMCVDRLFTVLERLAIAVENMAPVPSRTWDEQSQDRVDAARENFSNRMKWAADQGLATYRGRRVFASGDWLHPKHMTREQLRRFNNCGESTINLMLDWAEGLSEDVVYDF
jgi:hypothetical protein